MGIVRLPGYRPGSTTERAALRGGIAPPRRRLRVLRDGESGFCDRCAAPIEWGAVMRGTATYCSVECALGGTAG